MRTKTQTAAPEVFEDQYTEYEAEMPLWVAYARAPTCPSDDSLREVIEEMRKDNCWPLPDIAVLRLAKEQSLTLTGGVLGPETAPAYYTFVANVYAMNDPEAEFQHYSETLNNAEQDGCRRWVRKR